MIDIKIEGLDEVIADLGRVPQNAMRATVRAMNRAVVSGRAVLVKNIASDTGLKQKDVREAVRIRQASFSVPIARLSSSLKRIPLIDYHARGPEPSRGKGRGVSYRVGSASSRIQTAFITTMKSGHRGVFHRSGKSRLPIRELFGPSIGHVFAKYRSEAADRLLESFETNFKHESDRLLDEK